MPVMQTFAKPPGPGVIPSHTAAESSLSGVAVRLRQPHPANIRLTGYEGVVTNINMSKLFKATAFILASGSILSAQMTAPTPPTVAEIVAARVARLTKLLTLSSTQAATATNLFLVSVAADQTAATNLAAARTALTTAVETNSGIPAAANAIGALITQRAIADATADAGLYAILNMAQQTIYKELLAGGLDNIGPGRMGGGGPHH
jgi:hypothetical protein